MARTVDDFIVDFSKEEESGGGGGRNAHYKRGYYRVKIVNAKTGISSNKSTPFLELTLAFADGGKYQKAKKKLTEPLYITPKSMRRFRLLLQALDMPVPKKFDATKLAPKVKGKYLTVFIDDEKPQEGREEYGPRSRVTFEGFYPEDYEPDEDEEEEDDEDEEEDEDLEDDDEDEDEDEEDEDDDEDEEEEPAPKRSRSSKSKKPAAKKSSSKSKKRKSSDDDDEDLDDLDLDDM